MIQLLVIRRLPDTQLAPKPDRTGRNWLMMSSKNSSCQVIEAILAGPAQVSLSVPLAIVMTVADHASVPAVKADNAVRPSQLTNDFIALRFVEQVRQLDQVHHGFRSLPHRERPTDQRPDQDQHPEILPRAGGLLPARSPSPRNPIRAISNSRTRPSCPRRIGEFLYRIGNVKLGDY